MASSSTFLSTGGNVVEVKDTTWRTVGSLIYPGQQIAADGLVPKKVWVAAMAGDSSIGLELVLEDNMGNAVAGPSATYGGSVLQLFSLTPVRTSPLRRTGPPQVLLLKARNKGTKANMSPSQVGQLSVELGSST